MPVQGAEEQPRKYVQREDSQKRIAYPLVCTELVKRIAASTTQTTAESTSQYQRGISPK